MSDLRLSRPAAAASSLGQLAADHHRFTDKRVLLTGEPLVLASHNGREALMAALHLLPRICRNLTVQLPSGFSSLAEAASRAAARIQFGRDIELRGRADVQEFDAILSIGTRGHSVAPWTVAHADGWLARVASGAIDLPTPTGAENSISAVAAASLGVAEVFKRLIALDARRGPLHSSLAFDLHAYEVVPLDRRPRDALPPVVPAADVLLAGAGAIGNGVAYLLGRLPVRGHVTIIDKQKYGDENLGTCVVIGPDDIGKPKAQHLEEVLRAAGIDAHSFVGEISEFRQQYQGVPTVVLGGVDNIDARHDLQEFWPDVAIDGAIGSFIVQVGRHPWGANIGCLKCVFRHPTGPAAEIVASEATGLSVERIRQPDDLVTEEDIRTAPAGKQLWLASSLGRPICSVAADAVRLSTVAQRQGFAPSVPFVATMTAAMMVAELARWSAGSPSPLAPRYQFDMLQGPRLGSAVPQGRRSDCKCVERERNIAAFRRSRGK